MKKGVKNNHVLAVYYTKTMAMIVGLSMCAIEELEP